MINAFHSLITFANLKDSARTQSSIMAQCSALIRHDYDFVQVSIYKNLSFYVQTLSSSTVKLGFLIHYRLYYINMNYKTLSDVVETLYINKMKCINYLRKKFNIWHVHCPKEYKQL